MLTPKKVKHRKVRKGRSKGLSMRGNELSFGSYGLKSQAAGWIPSRQIEAARRAIIRYLRKGGKMWIRIFPDKPITRKGAETPMGGGKGDVDHYAFAIKPGRIIFEIEGIEQDLAKDALRKASAKLSVKTSIVQREES